MQATIGTVREIHKDMQTLYRGYNLYAVVTLPNGTQDYRRIVRVRCSRGQLEGRCLATGAWYPIISYEFM